jgi:hypothetical protein
MNTFLYLWQYLAELFSERETFKIKVVDKIKSHTSFSITSSEDRAVYEITSKNVVEPERPQITIKYSACTLHVSK